MAQTTLRAQHIPKINRRRYQFNVFRLKLEVLRIFGDGGRSSRWIDHSCIWRCCGLQCDPAQYQPINNNNPLGFDVPNSVRDIPKFWKIITNLSWKYNVQIVWNFLIFILLFWSYVSI